MGSSIKINSKKLKVLVDKKLEEIYNHRKEEYERAISELISRNNIKRKFILSRRKTFTREDAILELDKLDEFSESTKSRIFKKYCFQESRLLILKKFSELADEVKISKRDLLCLNLDIPAKK